MTKHRKQNWEWWGEFLKRQPTNNSTENAEKCFLKDNKPNAEQRMISRVS
jgi:hypothetical protein